jgi:hypothetical protein
MKRAIAALGMTAAAAVFVLAGMAAAPAPATPAPAGRPLIQMAILLDTSGSMDGLIEQAKSELWKIVNEFATARQGGVMPELQVALYEYGKSSIPASEGYLRMILPLTTDLDKVSEELFALRTNGGEEYCGQVIQAATSGLAWSGDARDLKVIFTAGNEPFTQGKTDYRESCKAAIGRGITVNTIFCGAHDEGVRTRWKDGADLADGSYMNIDQNRQTVHVDAPQDAEIARLGAALNGTYVAYGTAGKESLARQAEQDSAAATVAMAVNVQRQVAKASGQYRAGGWDLVDALAANPGALAEIKKEDLPAEMQTMTDAERKAYLETKARERADIQAKIQKLNAERKAFVAQKMKELAEQGGDTLDAAVIRAVRAQAVAAGFEFVE